MAEWKIGNYNIGLQNNVAFAKSYMDPILVPYANDLGSQDGFLGSVKIIKTKTGYIDPNVHGNSITEWGHTFQIANISSVGRTYSTKLRPNVKVDTLPEYLGTTWQIAECVRINSGGGTATFPIDEKYFDGGGLKVGANSIIGTNDLGFAETNPALSSTSDIEYRTQNYRVHHASFWGNSATQPGRYTIVPKVSMNIEVIDYKTEEYNTRNYIRNTGSAGGGSGAATEFWVG